MWLERSFVDVTNFYVPSPDRQRTYHYNFRISWRCSEMCCRVASHTKVSEEPINPEDGAIKFPRNSDTRLTNIHGATFPRTIFLMCYWCMKRPRARCKKSAEGDISRGPLCDMTVHKNHTIPQQRNNSAQETMTRASSYFIGKVIKDIPFNISLALFIPSVGP
jgi:hypothetical protein